MAEQLQTFSLLLLSVLTSLSFNAAQVEVYLSSFTYFSVVRLLNKIHESDLIAAHKHYVLTSSHGELHVTKGRLLNFTGTQSPTLPELAYVIIYPSHTEHQTMFSHSVSLCGRLSLYVHFLFRDCFLISF